MDCVVIGAGVVGAALAQRLARRDHRVVVVDAAPGIGGGCSAANAALLAPGHVTPLATPALLREAPRQLLRRPPAVRVGADPTLVPWLARLTLSARSATTTGPLLAELAQQSTRLHRALADEGLNPTLRRTGALDVTLAGAGTDQQLGTELVGARVVAHHDDEWVVESKAFISSMLDDATAHGAEVRFDTPVEELVVDRRRVVGIRTSTGEVRTGRVILAAGLGSGRLAAGAGLRLPLRGGRGYGVDVSLPAQDGLTMPVRIKDHRIVVTPLADRIRVCGSLEFGREGRPPDLRRAQALLEVARRVLPVLRDRPVLERWWGDRPCTYDGVPVIGSSTMGLSVATGHGMWGMILAPVTATLVEATLDQDQTAADNLWLSPDRFGSSD